jgi:hypothetical protein
MRDFYIRFGRRVSIPPTIQVLDEISPDYRARLIREGRDRVRPPKPLAGLPDIMRNPLKPIVTIRKNSS